MIEGFSIILISFVLMALEVNFALYVLLFGVVTALCSIFIFDRIDKREKR